MSTFPIDAGRGGAGDGSYAAGLLTLADGGTHGVESIARLTVREDASHASTASQRLPGVLDAVRGVLPLPNRLPLPARLAVSTIRAGLGVIEDGFGAGDAGPMCCEITFSDGTVIVARLPASLAAAIRHDRDIALGALARSGRADAAPVEAVPVAEGTTEALTSIFRYEKRNGRLRRIVEPDPSAKV